MRGSTPWTTWSSASKVRCPDPTLRRSVDNSCLSPGTCLGTVPLTTVDSATVVHVDLTRNAAREAAAFGWLNDDERKRHRRFVYDGPRRRFALCRTALRALLCSRLGCENGQLDFETDEHGKPAALVDGLPATISFNVSHSGEHGLIALAPRGRLGIDVEERVPHRNMDLLIDGVFGQTEQAALASARGYGKLHLFFRLWTVKEGAH